MLAKNSVEMNRRVHVRDAVFGKQNDSHIALAEEVNQIADNGVNRAQIGNDGGIYLIFGRDAESAFWPMPLQVVIQVRQINQI